jgi:hypothetical protein
MAVRTTFTSVRGVIDTELTDTQIDAMIVHANFLVNQKLEASGLTEVLLTEIEMWITAHIIATTKERQTTQEKIGDVSVNYQKNPLGFFESTTYGQFALALDTSGNLQTAAKKRAKITAIKQYPAS